MNNYSVDESFFRTFGIEIVTGRDFSADIAGDQTEAYILNETAVRMLGIDDPVGKPFAWAKGEVESGYGRADTKGGYIIGVVKDFHERSLKDRIRPSVYALDAKRFRIISVKTRPGKLLPTMDHFADVWGQYITNLSLIHI